MHLRLALCCPPLCGGTSYRLGNLDVCFLLVAAWLRRLDSRFADRHCDYHLAIEPVVYSLIGSRVQESGESGGRHPIPFNYGWPQTCKVCQTLQVSVRRAAVYPAWRQARPILVLFERYWAYNERRAPRTITRSCIQNPCESGQSVFYPSASPNDAKCSIKRRCTKIYPPPTRRRKIRSTQ